MRKIWDFHGGVHPQENKRQSLASGIATLPLPEELTLPLNQHTGAPAIPVVALGDQVLKGQLIAEPVGMVSAALHAPTSGVVTAIADRQVPHPSGMSTTCIVIRPDGRDQWCDHQGLAEPLAASGDQLLARVRQAGITGLGGASFPTAVKLSPRQTITTLIINGTECEPYITADDILMRERAEEIVAGASIIARILGDPQTLLIGVEDNKPQAFEALEAAATGTGIEVVEFPTKYPSGGEKQLIEILTGQQVPSGKLPAELGIVCQNVGTARAVYRAVVFGEPLISRITTVTGKACASNRNYEVLLGTPVSHLLAHSGFDPDRCTRLVMGGPMMGFTLPDLSVPVVKASNCILACDASESPAVAPPQQACIRCGLCAEACPATLLPQQLYWYSQARDFDKVQAHDLFDCIECGACSYVCPSNIPLVQYYRAAKGEIRKLNGEKLKSDLARQRFESHQARLEKAEAEKAAKREARRLAAEAAQARVADGAADPGTHQPGSADELIAAAMAKAAARKASPEQQQAKLERGLELATSRLAAAESKLTEAHANEVSGEPLEKLEAQAEEARRKLEEARRKLAEFKPQTSGDKQAAAVADKIQASPREQLEAKVATLTKTMAAAREKLAATDDDAIRAALEQGLEKQRHKLADAEQQLAELGPEGDQQPGDPQILDAAAAAIARAQARAAAATEQSPAEKLEASIESLTSRIAKARDKLATARGEGSEHVEVLQSSLDKLEAKLASAREQHRQLRDQPQHNEVERSRP